MSEQEEKLKQQDAQDQAVLEQEAEPEAGMEDAGQEAEEEVDAPEVKEVEFENLQQGSQGPSGRKRIDLLMDIVLPVSIELGRTKMYVKDILELERGSIVELDKMAGEPVDLYINNKKMAEGEVVVVDKHFGIRITNLIDPQDRIKNLGKEL